MATPWHRILGMALTQHFAGTSWQVDVEVDLAMAQQRLDIAIVRRRNDGVAPVWPDGFGTPVDYNLLTFKALKDPLNAWAIKELVAYSVNYRKQISPDRESLLPEECFRMLAASMHFPRQLASQVALQPQGPGAYDITWGTDKIRVLVLREMPEAEQNLVWNLFSGERDRVATAFKRLRPRVHSWSSLLNKLLGYYGLEGIPMPYTMADFEREVAEEVLDKMTPEQLLARLSLQQLLEKLSPEQRLEGLPAEKRLEGLSLDEIERYLKKLRGDQNGIPEARS